MASRLARETAKAAADDVNIFIEFVLSTPRKKIRQSGCHRTIQAHIAAYSRPGIIAHKGLGKTTQALMVALFWLGQDPNELIRIVCSDDQPAKERVSFLSTMIKENRRLHLVFPNLKPSTKQKAWSTYSCIVDREIYSKDPSIGAHGVLTQVEGGRATKIILDDVCDFNNTIRYPQKRSLVIKAINSVWIPLLNVGEMYASQKDEKEDLGGGKAVHIGTVHHEKDALSVARRNKAWKWIDLSVTGEPPVSPWPEQFTTKRLIKRREEIGTADFDLTMRNKIRSDEERIVKQSWIRRYFREIVRANLRVASWDIAGKKLERLSRRETRRDEPNWTAVAIADIAINDIIIADDVRRHASSVYVNLVKRRRNVSANGKMDWILAVNEEWGIDVNLFEAAGLQTDIPRDERMVVVRKEEIAPIGNKEDRLKRSSVLYENNAVAFREGFCDLGIDEVVNFGTTPDDDCFDALTQLVLYAIEKFGGVVNPELARAGGEGRAFAVADTKRDGRTIPTSSAFSYDLAPGRPGTSGFKDMKW